MAYNRGYGQQSSPWASGAPPMYGNHSHAPPPPPPQYGTPAYGHSSVPWNVTQPMRQSGGWGGPNTGGPNMHHMQPTQRRGGTNMRGPIPGPTGKRGNMGAWDGPPNKRFAKQGGGRGGQGGGNWRQGGGQGGGGGQKFQNKPFNRDNRRNNREVNRTKQNDTQLERRQQHDQAQKAAESLDKKEYQIEQKSEDSKQTDGKNLEIDSAQEKYLLAVFGYVCQVCSVFLKDKTARYEHCISEEHLKKFNAAEEERIQKEELEKKNNETPEETINANDNSEENKTNDNENKTNESLENGDKSESIENETNVETNAEELAQEPKDQTQTQTNEEEEIKTINEETPVIADQPIQPIDESEGKGLSSDSIPQTGVETPNPAVSSQPYSGGEYTPNRGRGNYQRGRGGHGGRGGPRGRGRNRGRGRK